MWNVDKLMCGNLIAHNSNAPFPKHELEEMCKTRQDKKEGQIAATPRSLEKLIHLYKNHMCCKNKLLYIPPIIVDMQNSVECE